jgi:glucose/arabinose dehydrogenase
MRVRFISAALLVLLVASGGFGQVQLKQILSGLNSPVYVTNAHDGSSRLFVIEQPGRILVLQPGSSAPAVFLDIRNRVSFSGERGLLGLTFHPGYSQNHRFFVDYTRVGDGATVISEFHTLQANTDAADPNSEIVLLVIPQPFENHNGGMVEFGSDGYLYIGMGDGGSGNDPGNRAQNIDELLGKILRIDIDTPTSETVLYSSPPSNPFSGSTPGRDEIYAYGFRNPWRFSFERTTGNLYVADVGQDTAEEIDIVALGGNYGWRVFEGTFCTGLGPAPCSTPGFIPPVAQYTHVNGRCAIIGGYVYHGAARALPVGAYIYGDLCTGEVFTLANGTQNVLIKMPFNISSFGEDESGELYVVFYQGTVHRIDRKVRAQTTSI